MRSFVLLIAFIISSRSQMIARICLEKKYQNKGLQAPEMKKRAQLLDGIVDYFKSNKDDADVIIYLAKSDEKKGPLIRKLMENFNKMEKGKCCNAGKDSISNALRFSREKLLRMMLSKYKNYNI